MSKRWTSADIDALEKRGFVVLRNDPIKPLNIIPEKKPDLRCHRSRGGKRTDLNNMFFRSSWEANYARILNYLKDKLGEVTKWEYETDEYFFHEVKRGCRSYKIDFKVWYSINPDVPLRIEIKGNMDGKSKTKLKRMAKYYPEIKIKLITEIDYRKLEDQFSGLIPNWEFDKKKFKKYLTMRGVI